MSASEKLKALDDLTTYPTGVIARSDAAHIRGRVLLVALPQIVAVVEAAERLDALDADGGVITTIGPATDAIEALGPALAALDEELS